MRKRRLVSARLEQKGKSSPQKPTIGGPSELSHSISMQDFCGKSEFKSLFRHLNSGLRFLLTLVLILALAFATCAAFIVFCRKCDEEVPVLSITSHKFFRRRKTPPCARPCCTWTRAPTWGLSAPSQLSQTPASRVLCQGREGFPVQKVMQAAPGAPLSGAGVKEGGEGGLKRGRAQGEEVVVGKQQ